MKLLSLEGKTIIGEEILFNKNNKYDYSIKVTSDNCKYFCA